MGIRYCEECDGKLEPHGDLDWNMCPNSNCCASGKQICEECADTESPACTYCEEGCSMCFLVHPNIMNSGYDNYQSDLAPACKFDGCPVYAVLEDKDRCLRCWEKYARELGCDTDETHEVFNFTECGHQSCLAYQNQMKCKEGECAECKENGQIKENEKKRKRELGLEKKDVKTMKNCLSKLNSDSAKAVIESWLEERAPKKKK